VNEGQCAIDRFRGAPAYNAPDASTDPGVRRLAAYNSGRTAGRPPEWRWLLVTWLKTIPPAIFFAGLTIYLISPQSPLEATVQWIFGVDVPLRTVYSSGRTTTTSAEGLAQMLIVGFSGLLAVFFGAVAIDALAAFRKDPTSESVNTTSGVGRSTMGLHHPVLARQRFGKPRRTGDLLRSAVLSRRRPIHRHDGQELEET
jgi:hypothetical protein